MAFLNIAPTGTVLPFAGSTAPEGWAICNGAALNRTNYAALFAVVSTTYGTGDGSTTFNLPDMQGVFPRGAGTNGTGNYGGATGHTPAGGSIGNKGRQRTAPNNMTSGFTGSAVTAANDNANHSHGAPSGSFATNNYPSAGQGYMWGGASSGGNFSINNQTSTLSTNATHGHSVTAAGTNSVTSTDTETTPAFLALNYIIKL